MKRHVCKTECISCRRRLIFLNPKLSITYSISPFFFFVFLICERSFGYHSFITFSNCWFVKWTAPNLCIPPSTGKHRSWRMKGKTGRYSWAETFFCLFYFDIFDDVAASARKFGFPLLLSVFTFLAISQHLYVYPPCISFIITLKIRFFLDVWYLQKNGIYCRLHLFSRGFFYFLWFFHPFFILRRRMVCLVIQLLEIESVCEKNTCIGTIISKYEYLIGWSI